MRNRSHKNFVILGACLLVLIFLNLIGWLSPFKNLIRNIFLKQFDSIYQLKVNTGEQYKFYSNKQALLDENAKCLLDLANLTKIQTTNKLLLEENNELKKQLNFKQEVKLPLVSARIIGQDADGADRVIIIDRGEESGIKIDQPVTVGEGILVGKIIKVEKNISFLRLINDNQNKIAATILNRDRSLGVVEGGYGISVRMGFIPRNEVIVIGDQVVTSGLERNIPRGLLIGTVAAIENEAYQPFQQAVLTPAVDLSKIFLVDVLLTN